MNRERIRQQFRQYRQRIDELEQEIEEQRYRREAVVARMESRAKAYRLEAEEKEQQAQSDRYYREDQIKSITNEIERARTCKDEWGEDRAIQKLKRL